MLVVGGGPAGLAAALRPPTSWRPRHPLRRVSGVRRQPRSAIGAARIDGDSAPDGCSSASRTLRRSPRVTLLTRTTAFGYFPHNLLGLNERITDHLARPAGS